MHWTYFSGQYKIIDCAPRLIPNNKSYFVKLNTPKNDFAKNV